MRKSIKIFVAMFIVILGIFKIPISVSAATTIPAATSDFYVNDFAQVFSTDEKSRLMDNAITLSNEHDGIQVVVTTVESLNGDSIENYALQMYNQYGIGKDDMGILILLATGDRQIRVEVGKAMESYINDSKAGRFIDKYAIPSLKDNKFDDGLINLQENLISEIVTCIEKEDSQTNANIISADLEPKKVDAKQFIFSFFGLVAIILLIILVIYYIHKIVEKNNKTKETINNLTDELEKNKKMFIQKEQHFQYEISSIKEQHQKEKASLIEKANYRNTELLNKYERQLSSLNKQIYNLSEENNQINSKCQAIQKEYSALKDRYERVNKLYPKADEEVTAMIEEEVRQYDMKKAREVNQLIIEVINLKASKDIVSDISSVLSSYHSLEEKQKSYVESDINKLKQLYQDSVELKEEYERKLEEERILKQIEEDKKVANSATESINSIISSITVGKSKDLERLKEARNIYEKLNKRSRNYFDNSILTRLDALIYEAKEDYAREEEIAKNKKIAAVAIASITAIIGYISYGKSRDLRKLKEAKNIYENLDYEARKYVDKSVIDKLDRLIREAQRDKEEEEEEERRRKKREEEEHRRRMQSISYSSFDGSSHHSGFGGSSGGGGASRGF